MEQKAARLVKSDRTNYLHTQDGAMCLGGITLVTSGTNARVATWPNHIGAVTLSLNNRSFSYGDEFRPQEARLLAQALLLAAEDAEKAIEAAYAKQMAEDDEVPA